MWVTVIGSGGEEAVGDVEVRIVGARGNDGVGISGGMVGMGNGVSDWRAMAIGCPCADS